MDQREEKFPQRDSAPEAEVYNRDFRRQKKAPKHVAAWNRDARAKDYMEDETWQTPGAKNRRGVNTLLLLLLGAVMAAAVFFALRG